MARIAPILIITFGILLAACGSDLNSKVPDGGWQLDESGDIATTSPTPEGLPQNYINHPASERRYPGPHSTVCDVPSGYDHSNPSDGKIEHPVIGSVVLIGLGPPEFEPPHIDILNYDLFLRFPRKSDRWHRFEMRRSAPGTIFNAMFQFKWDDMQSARLFLGVNSVAIGPTLITNDCQLPTQEDIERFLYEYGDVNVIFHNLTTNAVYRFDPGEPDGVRVYDPLIVLHSGTPATITWELPINRPKTGIPGFLETNY